MYTEATKKKREGMAGKEENAGEKKKKYNSNISVASRGRRDFGVMTLFNRSPQAYQKINAMRAQHSDGRSAYQAEQESAVFEGVGHGEYPGPETALDQM